jgi:hypothetical protein
VSKGPASGIPAKGEGRGGPARGYTWPPFEPGNVAAIRHGAFSERRIAPLADRARAGLLDAAPWLDSPAFSPAVDAWARVEARAALVGAYVDENGPLDDEGRPRAATELLVRLERLALALRQAVGLDPASRARIERDLAAGVRDLDLSDAIAEGRRFRTGRTA